MLGKLYIMDAKIHRIQTLGLVTHERATIKIAMARYHNPCAAVCERRLRMTDQHSLCNVILPDVETAGIARQTHVFATIFKGNGSH